MNFPADLKYTAEHEWIKVSGNEAYVGITDFAQNELGDIVFVDISTVGQEVDKDGNFGSVEAVKTVSDLFLPVSGKVLEINPALESSPDLVNTDPYGQGWMVKISLSNPSEIDSLMDVDTYKTLVGK